MKVQVILADDIYKELKKIALEEERSINGQINYIIKLYIESKKKESN